MPRSCASLQLSSSARSLRSWSVGQGCSRIFHGATSRSRSSGGLPGRQSESSLPAPLALTAAAVAERTCRAASGVSSGPCRGISRRDGDGRGSGSRYAGDSGTGSLVGTARSVGPALLASVPLQAPDGRCLAYSYVTISPWSVALFAIPAVAAQRLLILYRQQRETSEALGSANARLARANLSFATALVATLDARDRYTAGHSASVADLRPRHRRAPGSLAAGAGLGPCLRARP